MQQHSLYWTALRDRMEGCDFATTHIGVSGVSQSCTPRLGPDHCIVPEYLEATATNESVVSHRPRASGTNVNCVQGVSLVFPLSLLPSWRSTLEPRPRNAATPRPCWHQSRARHDLTLNAKATHLALLTVSSKRWTNVKMLASFTFYIHFIIHPRDDKCYVNFGSFIVRHWRVAY